MYPVIEGSPDWNVEIHGRAFARAIEQLARTIRRAGFPDPFEYWVEPRGEVEARGGTYNEQWHNPMDGLAMIEAMRAAVKSNPSQFAPQDDLMQDLEAFRVALDRAAGEKRRWYLGMSS